MRRLFLILVGFSFLFPSFAMAQEEEAEEETEEEDEEEDDEELEDDEEEEEESDAPVKVKPKTMTSPMAGSLWNENRTRMLVGMEGNSRMVGDLITIEISEETSSQVSAGTKTKRDSAVNATVGSMFGLKQSIVTANPNMGGEISLDTSKTSSFTGDGNTTRNGSLEGKLTCKVIQVESNGNLIIFGWKEVRSNRETQYLSLSGVVRPQDIRADNTILSDLIADVRIEYTGAGVISDKQGPGFGTRIIDNVWPF